MSGKKKSHAHSGHRKRMRQRFAESGMSFAAYPPHEVLEMLLYFSHRRMNTNPLGHTLHDRFGSVGGVLSAEPEQLAGIKGVGAETAARFAYWNELLKRCEK